VKGKIKLLLFLLLSVFISITAWWAWDRGHIPGNPRAISAAAMQPALLRHLMTVPRGQHGGCLAPELAYPRPEIQGQEGIGQRPIPGQFAVTLLVQARIPEQQRRERQLAQMSYLARQGFFAEAEATVLTDAGPRAARQYALTWKGYAEGGPQHYGTPCFRIGEPAFEAIEALEKQRERLAGIEAWSVTYRTGVREVPGWAASDEARALFPGLKSRTEAARGKALLLRGDTGWISQAEARLQLLDPREGAAAVAARHVEELRARSTAPTLDIAAARAALEAHVAGAAWARHRNAACLPMRLLRGGDERGAAVREDEFSVTYFDLPRTTRPAYSRGFMVTTLHALHALEAAGLARSRPTGPGEVVFGRVKVKASRGVRYSVSPEALEALGVGRGNPCLPAGRLKVEVLAVRSTGPGLAQVAARGKVSETPAWALRVAEHLPALKAVLAEGVPISGQLVHSAQGWRFAALIPHYPELQSQSVPPPLRRLLPQTEAAHPLVAAPAVLQ
jgi:hypothetical protein